MHILLVAKTAFKNQINCWFACFLISSTAACDLWPCEWSVSAFDPSLSQKKTKQKPGPWTAQAGRRAEGVDVRPPPAPSCKWQQLKRQLTEWFPKRPRLFSCLLLPSFLSFFFVVSCFRHPMKRSLLRWEVTAQPHLNNPHRQSRFRVLFPRQ